MANTTYNKKRPYKRRANKKKTPVKTSTVPKVATIAKAVVNRMLEHKLAVSRKQIYLRCPGAGGGTNFNADCIIPLTPYSGVSNLGIPQGVSINQRVGNKIRVKSLIMRYVIVPYLYDATNNPTPTPLDITMYIFKNKTYPNLTNANMSDFYKFGAGTESFAGDVSDMVKVVNRNNYVLHKKVIHKLGNSDYFSTIAPVDQSRY